MLKNFGQNHPVPIECNIDKIDDVKREMERVVANKIEIKMSNINKDKPLITDNGNYLILAWFNKIESDLEEKLLKINGVLESGLFIGYDIIVIK